MASLASNIAYTPQGQTVRLGKELGRGGEGAVFEVPDNPELVAKIYHKPVEAARADKLRKMVSIATNELTRYAAWPSNLLLDSSHGSLIGLVMRRVTGYKQIHELYTPKSRLQQFPNATWPFLIHSATNTARTFAAFHTHGVVIADVNQGNVLVGRDAIVALIDCDSFQICANGSQFVCDVGVSTFTPPELQDRDLSSVLRSPNHDNFGLALLIFHLLFMGRHPFAGRYLGSGEMSVERSIKECRFAFSRRASARQMAPPPNSPTLDDVPGSLAALFEKAFSAECAAGGARPTAAEWIMTLQELSRNLSTCNRVSAHQYFRGLSHCPWCSIENSSGVLLFLQIGRACTSTFDVNVVWSQILSVQAPGPVPALLTRSDIRQQFVASPEAVAAGLKRRRRRLLGIGIVALVVIFCFAVGIDIAVAFWMTVGAVIIAGKFGYIPRNDATYKAACDAGTRKYSAVQQQWATRAGDATFTTKIRELESLKKNYMQLPQLRIERLQELERNRRNTQLMQFLDRHYIRDAHISGIGPGRTVLLSSWNIDTAADLSWQRLQSVNGIGPKYATNLMLWRQKIENRFVFDSRLGVDPIEIAKMDRELTQRRTELERGLLSGLTDLQRVRQQIVSARAALQREAEGALLEVMQAQVNIAAS